MTRRPTPGRRSARSPWPSTGGRAGRCAPPPPPWPGSSRSAGQRRGSGSGPGTRGVGGFGAAYVTLSASIPLHMVCARVVTAPMSYLLTSRIARGRLGFLMTNTFYLCSGERWGSGGPTHSVPFRSPNPFAFTGYVCARGKRSRCSIIFFCSATRQASDGTPPPAPRSAGRPGAPGCPSNGSPPGRSPCSASRHAPFT